MDIQYLLSKSFFLIIGLIIFVIFLKVTTFSAKLLILAPHIFAQIEADEVKGFLNFLRAFSFYVKNPQNLKTIYIRNGKCSYKPVYLAYKSETNTNN